MKLRTRLLFALVPLVTIPLGLLSWAALNERLTAVQTESHRQIETIARQIQREMQTKSEVVRANMELFSQSSMLTRYLAVDNEQQRYAIYQPTLLKLLASYQRVYPEYFELRVILPDGYEDTRVTALDIPNLTDEEYETDYFQYARRHYDSFASNIIRYPDTGEAVMMVSKRIELRDQAANRVIEKPQLRGYLFATIDLSFLKQHLVYNRQNVNTHIDFVDVDGNRLFTDIDKTPVGDNMQIERRDLNASLRSSEPTQISFGAEKRIAQVLKLHRGLYCVVSLPDSSVKASTNQLRNIATFIFLSALLSTTMLLFYFLRLLVLNPLRKLRQAAQDLGNTQSGLEVDVSRSDEIGDLARTFSEMRDRVTESNEKMSYLAYHDSLTGLPNRLMFNEMLEKVVDKAQDSNLSLGLMFLDLDDFKTINDSLGHLFGDQLLCQVAVRLCDLTSDPAFLYRKSATNLDFTVARIGGDEFVIVVKNIEDGQLALDIAGEITASISRPYRLGKRTLNISTSLGLTMYPGDGQSAEELVRNADIAMYHAKENGKNKYERFTPSMNVSLQYRIELEKSLRQAIRNDEFALYYQPIIDVNDGSIVSAEALIRWQHPDRGLLPPSEFMGVVEETDLIYAVGDWVLKSACALNNKWQQAGMSSVPISVNVSSQQMVSETFTSDVLAILDDSGITADYLYLELTETSIMSNLEVALANITELRNRGVEVSMDDFGTGYSSLSLLRQIPVKTIKIDQSFVHEIDSTRQGAEVFASIISMCNSMELDIVAEGVETSEQLHLLKQHGCNRCQGYLFSRPVSEHAFRQLLDRPITWLDHFRDSATQFDAGDIPSEDAVGQKIRNVG